MKRFLELTTAQDMGLAGNPLALGYDPYFEDRSLGRFPAQGIQLLLDFPNGYILGCKMIPK